MEWSRPESIPYPNIWRKFDGIREINGEKPKFWIQDLTEDLVDVATNAMLTGFVKEEPLCKYSKLADDPVSLADGSELYRHLLKSKLSLACMTKDSEGTPKLAGICCLERVSKDDNQHVEFTGERINKLLLLLSYIYSVKDPFTHFGVDEYITDKGIYILPEFRGQRICGEILETWVPLCKAVGMKVIIGNFTSIISQKAADRAGFQELNSFPYEDLEKVNPKFSLPGIQEHTKNLRLLYKTV